MGGHAAAHRTVLGRRPGLGQLLARRRRRADRAAGRAAADRHHDGLLPRALRATRDKKAGPLPAGQELTLLTAPKFIADTLGLHNVEIWSAQFADMSLDYCKQIKAAAEAVKSRITNIQVDGSENLSDPDAAKRAASVGRSSDGWIGPLRSARRPAAPIPVAARPRRGM